MITTLRTGALTLASAEYKFTVHKTLTIRLTADADHKLYGDVNIELSGVDDVDIHDVHGNLVEDFFNDTFKFTKTSATELEYSQKIQDGVDPSETFVSLGDVSVRATGSVEITDYSKLISGTDDAISVAGTAFTAQSGSAAEGDATFQAATSNDATAASLAAQINEHATVGLQVAATADGAVITLQANVVGTGGNSITLSYTDNDSNIGATVSGATLEDGEDGVGSEIDNASIDLLIGKYDFYLLGSNDSNFAGATIGIKYLNIANTGVDGVESVFNEDGADDVLSINNVTMSFGYPARISLKDDNSGVTNIPLVING